jgi:hypothetical protein
MPLQYLSNTCIPAILCRSPAHARVTWPQDHADENGTDGQTVGAAGATQHQEDDPMTESPDLRSPVSVHCPLLTLTHVRRKLVLTNGSTHDVWHCSSCRYRKVCWTLPHANSISSQQIQGRTALSPRLKRRACVRCLQCMSHVRFATQRTHPIGLRSSCVTARQKRIAPLLAALVPCHDARSRSPTALTDDGATRQAVEGDAAEGGMAIADGATTAAAAIAPPSMQQVRTWAWRAIHVVRVMYPPQHEVCGPPHLPPIVRGSEVCLTVRHHSRASPLRFSCRIIIMIHTHTHRASVLVPAFKGQSFLLASRPQMRLSHRL